MDNRQRGSDSSSLVELPELEEYCPSCGEWVSYLAFNHSTGWCIACSGSDHQLRCTQCGGVIVEEHGRTMCHPCRQEQWYIKHADELEYLMVVKGYSLALARTTIIRIRRPICQWCRHPIKGANERALFHKGKDFKSCRSAAVKYNRLIKQGLTADQALATIKASRKEGT